MVKHPNGRSGEYLLPRIDVKSARLVGECRALRCDVKQTRRSVSTAYLTERTPYEEVCHNGLGASLTLGTNGGDDALGSEPLVGRIREGSHIDGISIRGADIGHPAVAVAVTGRGRGNMESTTREEMAVAILAVAVAVAPTQAAEYGRLEEPTTRVNMSGRSDHRITRRW